MLLQNVTRYYPALTTTTSHTRHCNTPSSGLARK